MNGEAVYFLLLGAVAVVCGLFMLGCASRAAAHKQRGFLVFSLIMVGWNLGFAWYDISCFLAQLGPEVVK